MTGVAGVARGLGVAAVLGVVGRLLAQPRWVRADDPELEQAPEQLEPVADVAPVQTQTAQEQLAAAKHESFRLLVEAAERHGVDVQRFLRVAWCESGWNPTAIGPPVWNATMRRYDRAMGLLQFMPGTWQAASYQAGWPGASPFDPAANADVGAFWFRRRPQEWVCK